MNPIDALFAKPLFQALGWALINFIWQGTVIAMILATTNIFLQRKSANARYIAACIALAFMLAVPICTAVFTSSKPLTSSSAPVNSITAPGKSQNPEAIAYRQSSNEVASAPVQVASISFVQTAKERLLHYMPWLVAIWAIGVVLLSLRFLGGIAITRRLKNSQTLQVTTWLQERVTQISAELRISKPVVVLQSLLVEVPTVIGWLRPVILLPASALAGLTPQQLESLLVHELAHIRRHDYLVNLLQTTVETLLFYHPAVWWVSQQVREEREHCCDDLAVAVCGDVLTYARALTELEQLRNVSPQLAMAANGGSLLRRIQRLIGSPAPASRRVTSWIAGLLAMITLCALLTSAHTKALSRELTIPEGNKPIPGLSVVIPQTQTLDHPFSKSITASSEKPKLGDESRELASVSPEPSTTTSGTAESVANPAVAPQDGHGDFIDEMTSAGYTNLTVDELIALKNSGVTAQFIKEMNTAAGSKLSVRELISLRNMGVSSTYIGELRSLGYDKLTIRDVTSMAVQGVTPEFIRKLNDLGYKNLSPHELTSMKIQGVTPQFISELRDLGYDHLTPQELTSMSVQGVTPGFIKGMKDVGLKNLSSRQLISMSIQGVTPTFVKEMGDAGYKNLSSEELTSMAIQGVNPKYVKEMKDIGYANLSARDLIKFSIHGITPAFLKKARDHGFKDLSVDQLIRLSEAAIF